MVTCDNCGKKFLYQYRKRGAVIMCYSCDWEDFKRRYGSNSLLMPVDDGR